MWLFSILHPRGLPAQLLIRRTRIAAKPRHFSLLCLNIMGYFKTTQTLRVQHVKSSDEMTAALKEKIRLVSRIPIAVKPQVMLETNTIVSVY